MLIPSLSCPRGAPKLVPQYLSIKGDAQIQAARVYCLREASNRAGYSETLHKDLSAFLGWYYSKEGRFDMDKLMHLRNTFVQRHESYQGREKRRMCTPEKVSEHCSQDNLRPHLYSGGSHTRTHVYPHTALFGQVRSEPILKLRVRWLVGGQVPGQ